MSTYYEELTKSESFAMARPADRLRIPCAEVDSLRSRLAESQRELQEYSATMVDRVKDLTARLAAAERKASEGEKDKARLDWVQAQSVGGFLWGFRRFPVTGGAGMYQLIPFVKDDSLHESVRAAIDAAMRKGE